MFFSILSSFVLIGSTVAQTYLQQMASLSIVHLQVSDYITVLSHIYMGPGAHPQHEEYWVFQKQGEIIIRMVAELAFNQQVPNVVPMEDTQSDEEVTEDWKKAAKGIINKHVSGIESAWMQNPSFRLQVLDATTGLMNRIKRDPHILDGHKRGNFLIFKRLSEIFDNYSTEAEYEEFLTQYGTPNQ